MEISLSYLNYNIPSVFRL
jgi:hypothetical protein